MSAQRIPVGTAVKAYPGFRPDDPDPNARALSRELVTRTRSEVWQLGDGTPVVAVEGHAGGIALTHIDVLPKAGGSR